MFTDPTQFSQTLKALKSLSHFSQTFKDHANPEREWKRGRESQTERVRQTDQSRSSGWGVDSLVDFVAHVVDLTPDLVAQQVHLLHHRPYDASLQSDTTHTHTQCRGISLAEEMRRANAGCKVHRFTYFTTDPKDQPPLQSHTAPWVSLLVWLWSINAGCKVYTNTGLLTSPLSQRTFSAITHSTLGITISLAVKHQCWLQSIH